MWQGWTFAGAHAVVRLLVDCGFAEAFVVPLRSRPGRYAVEARGPGFRTLYYRPTEVLALFSPCLMGRDWGVN